MKRVEGVPEAQLGVEEYDSMMMGCAEESLHRTFKRRINKHVKISEPVWMTGKIRDEMKKRKKEIEKKETAERRKRGNVRNYIGNKKS